MRRSQAGVRARCCPALERLDHRRGSAARTPAFRAEGRTVGGSTTINWTTCFRTPERILEHWRTVHGIEGLDSETLRPHFEAVEERLNIHVWPEDQGTTYIFIHILFPLCVYSFCSFLSMMTSWLSGRLHQQPTGTLYVQSNATTG